MEEVIAVLIGAGIVALIPVLRPAMNSVVKSAVKGGLVIEGATKGAIDDVSQYWHGVVNQAKMEMQASDQAAQKTPPAVEAAAEAGKTVKAGAEETQKAARPPSPRRRRAAQ